jgi:hypothetical protein
MKARLATFGDFRCARCHVIVPSTHLISGVNNRNHCPYCLWSCHLDLYAAGDRLSACKASMKPIGLTMKNGRNKYQREARGELMLIHQCTVCRALSINRIAADDDAGTVLAVFRESLVLRHLTDALCQENGIVMLKTKDTKIVYTQLYGHGSEVSIITNT